MALVLRQPREGQGGVSPGQGQGGIREGSRSLSSRERSPPAAGWEQLEMKALGLGVVRGLGGGRCVEMPPPPPVPSFT